MQTVIESVTIGQTVANRYENSGFFFDSRTPAAVRYAIECAHASRRRVRVFYGDTETGEAWPEEYDVMGTIGRSCGRVKVPLLMASARSTGGGALLDACIVAIIDTKTRAFLYRHPQFDPGEWAEVAPVSDGYISAAAHNGKLHAQFKTADGARRYIGFMRGERFSK